MRSIPANLREKIAALTSTQAGALAVGGVAVGGVAVGAAANLHQLPLGVVHEWMSVEDETPSRDRWIAPHGMILFLLWQMLEAETASTVAASTAVGRSRERLVAWIGRRAWPAPRAMIDAQGSRALLARSIFIDTEACRVDTEACRVDTEARRVDAGEHRLWAAEQALACDGVMAAIWDAEGFDMVASRRTQLAAARSHDRLPVLALAVRPWRERTILTAAATRWGVHPVAQESAEVRTEARADAPAWRAELLRGRGSAGFGGESRVLQCTAPWSWRGG